ncbi:hypothetical protein [Actinophytocola glycyrrhizae]|uniref:DUF1648 domain-containing protein n=1 Tax=Actinophytocola glycyrrhizae TaxID=2044873 RepID=A0ABV9RW25_9PSEU
MAHRPTLRPTLLAGAPQLLAVAPAALTMLVAWDRLPERMATRFAFDGSVTDDMSRPAMLVTTIGAGLVLSVVLGLTNRSTSGTRISRWDMPRLLVAVSWALAGFLGVVLFMVVVSNIDAPEPAAVTMSAVVLLYALGAAVVTGAVGALVAPRSATPPPGDREPPTMDLGPAEHVEWSRSITAPWLVVLGVVLLLAGLLLGWSAGWGAGVPLAVAGLLLSLLSSATVTADEHGVRVRFTPFGWPRLRVGMDEIESAVAEDVTPAQFGGWGYRVVPGASGLVLRQGPALVITRTSGRKFVVTVDDARTAARLLNGLRGRRR